MTESNGEIQALINLLDDPDKSVQETVSKRLQEIGEAVIKPLENSWETSLSLDVQERIEWIIRNIQQNVLRNDLHQWIDGGGDNLLYGAFLMAKVQYPELEYDILDHKVEALRSQIWLELNDQLTAMEKVKVSASRIEHIVKSDNPALLAKLVEQLLSGK